MDLSSAFEKPAAAAVPLVAPVLGKRPRPVEAAPPPAPAADADALAAEAQATEAASDSAAAAAERDPNKKSRRETRNEKFKLGQEREAPERLARTLFVGNVPLTLTAKKLARLFQKHVNEKLHKGEEKAAEGKPAAAASAAADSDDDSDAGADGAAGVAAKKPAHRYGRDIESVRFRSVAITGLAVASGSDFHAMRKAGFIKKSFDKDARDTANAYVVFRSPESARACLALNSLLVEGKHLRVDSCAPASGGDGGGKYDHKRTVFVGNVERRTGDEELRAHFAGLVSGGDASVEAVRVVRDKATQEAKGIAYVLFTERTHVAEALLAGHGSELRGRTLRVSRCTADGSAPGRPGAAAAAAAGGPVRKPQFMGSVGAAKVGGAGQPAYPSSKRGPDGKKLRHRHRVPGGDAAAKEGGAPAAPAPAPAVAAAKPPAQQPQQPRQDKKKEGGSGKPQQPKPAGGDAPAAAAAAAKPPAQSQSQQPRPEKKKEGGKPAQPKPAAATDAPKATGAAAPAAPAKPAAKHQPKPKPAGGSDAPPKPKDAKKTGGGGGKPKA